MGTKKLDSFKFHEMLEDWIKAFAENAGIDTDDIPEDFMTMQDAISDYSWVFDNQPEIFDELGADEDTTDDCVVEVETDEYGHVKNVDKAVNDLCKMNNLIPPYAE